LKKYFCSTNRKYTKFNKNADELGQALYEKKEGLKHLFVLSEGSFVNGSSIKGLEHKIEDAVSITGGMCGDDARFEKTMASYKEKKERLF
jgi:hypothetical protein